MKILCRYCDQEEKDWNESGCCQPGQASRYVPTYTGTCMDLTVSLDTSNGHPLILSHGVFFSYG